MAGWLTTSHMCSSLSRYEFSLPCDVLWCLSDGSFDGLIALQGKKEAPKVVSVEVRTAKQELSEHLLHEVVAALK
jgi:hypothetical protein